jgi:hypothetical protein
VIRFDIPAPPLPARVDALDAKWRGRAKKRTDRFRAARSYTERSSIWSEVKPLYMTLQGENKCVYCERKFGSVQMSTVEHDLEHFRPKSHVDAWTLPAGLQGMGIAVTTPPPRNKGYYLLPYNLENYSSSCKTCNTRYKLDRFPVSGTYNMRGEDPRLLLGEQPLLIYPIGNWDIDPETVISFLGYMPQAGPATSPDYHRGLVTIAFFGLDDIDLRSDLFLERAAMIVSMHPFLRDANDPAKTAAERASAQAKIDRWTSDRAAHANCARSFERLFKANRAEADACLKVADEYWTSKS